MEWLKNCKNLVCENYLELGKQSVVSNQKKIERLTKDKCLPQDYSGEWSDDLITSFLATLSFMDSNNFVSNIGFGEREGRVKSRLVKQRCFSLSHGIGRSGDINAVQPKATGSSIILKLCCRLALQTLRIAGARVTKKCIVVPLCTGMSIALVLRTVVYLKELQLQKSKKNWKSPKYVVWSRIDQKTCLKCIFSAGLIPYVVHTKFEKNKKTGKEGDSLVTDIEGIKKAFKTLGKENVACVLSTSSCFAPRTPDNIIEISKLCKEENIAHVVNNAYGVQCLNTMSNLNQAMKIGRVDAYIQSTDKNYQVPVGGAIIASASEDFVSNCSNMYSGRGSMSPILDLFITLLQTSQKRWLDDLIGRKALMMDYLVPEVKKIAGKFNERVLNTQKKNHISFAMTLDTFKTPLNVGGKLFYKQITGPRCFVNGQKKSIMGLDFPNYGCHTQEYPHNFIVMSCAIGLTKEMCKKLLKKLESVLKDIQKSEMAKGKTSASIKVH